LIVLIWSPNYNLYQFGPLCFALLLVLVLSVSFSKKNVEMTKTSNIAKYN